MEETHLLLNTIKINYIVLESALGYGQSAIVATARKTREGRRAAHAPKGDQLASEKWADRWLSMKNGH